MSSCRAKIEHNKENKVIKFPATEVPYEVTFGEVLRRNSDYCNWLLGFGYLDDMITFKTSGSRKRIIRLGKYYGRTYGEIMRGDNQYCDWVFNLKDLNGEILNFQEWIIGYYKTNS